MDIVQTQAQQIATLSAKIEALTDVVRMLCVQQGARLNKQQLADRLGVHRNTVTNMLKRDRRMPPSGKWGQTGAAVFTALGNGGRTAAGTQSLIHPLLWIPRDRERLVELTHRARGLHRPCWRCWHLRADNYRLHLGLGRI